MIKLTPNARTSRLSAVLDKIIAEYKPPGKVWGKKVENPDLSEEKVRECVKMSKEINVAEEVYAYFILKKNHEMELENAAKGLFPNSEFISVSGRFHYMPKSAMSWHTNLNTEGWRVYATRVDENDQSFFRYCPWNKDVEKIKAVTEYEQKGWQFRAFEITKSTPYWHCVSNFGETNNRYSFGFRFKK